MRRAASPQLGAAVKETPPKSGLCDLGLQENATTYFGCMKRFIAEFWIGPAYAMIKPVIHVRRLTDTATNREYPAMKLSAIVARV